MTWILPVQQTAHRSPLTDDRSESEQDVPREEDRDDQDHPLNPMNSALSLHSGAGHSLDDRRHSRRRDFDRASLTNRELFKYFMEDGRDPKKLQRYFDLVVERLDGEIRRRQDAERRALELAQRFKFVNESRIAAQQELDRVHAELRMYKVQLDNAQREILRGSDLLKDTEAQRDSAEAAAARARSLARRLKEEQLMLRAREEGRREGYREGLQRGYQQARGGGLDGLPLAVPPAGLPPLGSMGVDPSRTDPLDGLPMMNLPSPSLPANVHLSSAFDTAYRDASGHAPDGDGFDAGAQGSRFREIMGSPGASTLRSAPLGSATQPAEPSGWQQTADDGARYAHPAPVHNLPPSPRHTDYTIPPDGYIPTMGPDNTIPVPPPHELARPASMSSMRPSDASVADDLPTGVAPGVSARDYAYPQRSRGSPRSYADSLPSTTISQFELVSSPRTATRGLRERSSGLSAIPEVSSSMEFSPGTEGRARSSIIPDSASFPGPEPRGSVGDLGNLGGLSRSRSRDDNQRIADELRYSDPEEMEQWRRSTASQAQPSTPRERFQGPPRPAHVSVPSPLGGPSMTPGTPAASHTPSHRRSRSAQSPLSDSRSYLGTGSSSRDHHQTASSSAEISIQIEPPSGSGSNVSPSSLNYGMLSPASSRQRLPQHVQSSAGMAVPTYSNGYDMGGVPPAGYPYGPPNPHGQTQRYDIPPSLVPGAPPSPRRTPEPLQGFQNYPTPGSSSSSSFARPVSRGSRAPSVGPGGSTSDLAFRSRTPSVRPPSSVGNERPPSARPVTPGRSYAAAPVPSTVGYAETSGVPSVLRSPSRASSRQSLRPELVRPSSRASADLQRSLSLNAGSTPAAMPRPLSATAPLHRSPSASSINSETARKSGGYRHYDSSEQLDAAWLASSNDLTSMQSPQTMANTRTNAVYADPGPTRMRPSSPSMSYTSFRS
ncbi:hypothetical protein BD414DRAFT_472481 [Trametes punicea]|nr:hypothetical protein BD414DRAFT_472481 [Trametes punicea]